MKVHKLAMHDVLTASEPPKGVVITPSPLVKEVTTKCSKFGNRAIWDDKGSYTTRRRISEPSVSGSIVPHSVEKLIYAEDWLEHMKRSGSCLLNHGNDTGCGAGLLLGMTTNVFLAESVNGTVTRRGDEYAQIVSYNGQLAIYLPRIYGDAGWRTKLARLVYTLRLPVIVPMKSGFRGVEVTSVDYDNLGVFAELASVSHGTITPALSGEYGHYKSVVVDDLPYVYPHIQKSTLWYYTTAFTRYIPITKSILANKLDVSKSITIGGYAKTGFVGAK
jgi:hypothetical protein